MRLQLLTCAVEGEETGSLENYQVYPAFLVILNLQTPTLTSGKRQKEEKKDVNHLTVLSVTVVNKRLRLWQYTLMAISLFAFTRCRQCELVSHTVPLYILYCAL